MYCTCCVIALAGHKVVIDASMSIYQYQYYLVSVSDCRQTGWICLVYCTCCVIAGRKVAIDASMSIYQFLIAVRQDGSQLTNEEGETTRYTFQGFLFQAFLPLTFESNPCSSKCPLCVWFAFNFWVDKKKQKNICSNFFDHFTFYILLFPHVLTLYFLLYCNC